MKKIKLSKLENKYYYGISRTFWHIIIGLAVLGVILGTLTFLWSKVPPSKKHVVKSEKPIKPNYPKTKPVSFDNLLNAIPKKQKTWQSNVEIVEDEDYYESVDQKIEIPNTVDSVAVAIFERTLGETKSLISLEKNKLFWEGKKNLVYKNPRDKRRYKITKNPKYAPTWVASQSNPGFKQNFLNNTKRIKDYRKKASLLKSYNTILKNVTASNRTDFLNRFLRNRINNNVLDKLVYINTNIAPILSKIDSTNQPKTYTKLFWFVSNNPNDGKPLVSYLNEIISNFTINKRLDIIRLVFREYSNNYNNNLSSLKEATNQFLPYLKKLDIEQQDTALKIFYNLYRKNNVERDNNVKEIDYTYQQTLEEWNRTYQQQLNEAELEYEAKKNKKRITSTWSVKSIAVGFATVLILSLFLLIFSMVRNVNKLAEAMLQNNKKDVL